MSDVRYQQSSAIMATDLSANETVMMDAEVAQYFGLGETGPAVWRCFAEPRTVAEVAHSLSAQFEAAAGVIDADVEAFVAKLVEKKILVIAE